MFASIKYPCYAIAVFKTLVVAKPIIPIPDIVLFEENNTISINAGSAIDFSWSTGETSIIIANWRIRCNSDQNYNLFCSSSEKI
jgi:hypothetical protein